MIFLICHDKNCTEIERFTDKNKAHARRMELEMKFKGTKLVFDLDAQNEEAVRRTHGHYFE